MVGFNVKDGRNGVLVEGKNGISAEVVQHSANSDSASSEIITFSVKYGLLVHAEALRHRMLSRGVKSNRAIPMHVIRGEVLSDPYVPVWFGGRQKGMVADNEMRFKVIGRFLWKAARYPACGIHWMAEKLGAHKEWANRLLNPWQFVRETITYTEGDNFYNLRIHKDAQKDIKEMASCMYEAYKRSKAMLIENGDWHVPYVTRNVEKGVVKYFDSDNTELSVDDAIKCSAARCARSSYDNHDKTMPLAKYDFKLYNDLIESDPAHASPVEHQATPMKSLQQNIYEGVSDIEDGVTHIDKDMNAWSGNFKGWIQFRQTLENHTCWTYKP